MRIGVSESQTLSELRKDARDTFKSSKWKKEERADQEREGHMYENVRLPLRSGVQKLF